MGWWWWWWWWRRKAIEMWFHGLPNLYKRAKSTFFSVYILLPRSWHELVLLWSRISILMWTNRIWSCLMIRWLTSVKTSELWTSLLVVLIIEISARFISCRILFHQGKGSRSIRLNSHYLVLFKNLIIVFLCFYNNKSRFCLGIFTVEPFCMQMLAF